jgi:hypothetical protein
MVCSNHENRNTLPFRRVLKRNTGLEISIWSLRAEEIEEAFFKVKYHPQVRNRWLISFDNIIFVLDRKKLSFVVNFVISYFLFI